MKRRRLSCWRRRRIPVQPGCYLGEFQRCAERRGGSSNSGCHGANNLSEPMMQLNSTETSPGPTNSAAQTTSRKLGAGFTKFELNHSNKGALLFSDDSYPTTTLPINLAITFTTFNLPSLLVKNIGRPGIYCKGLCTGPADARDLCSQQQQSTTTAAFRDFCTMPVIHCTNS
ncbi:hypothetical protein PspLS_04900 [Pyricularia sp. CBS 133598]|nr:hypothetical protein PspLS_04900 [Pyricularia sp. CBS 133598]